MDFLPYAVTIDTGDTFDIEFPLSAHTEDSVRVLQLLTTLMNALGSDLKVLGETSDGDILQAVSMALVIRARVVHAPEPTMRVIVGDLTNSALQACYDADRKSEPAGYGKGGRQAILDRRNGQSSSELVAFRWNLTH